ncbi:DUF6270 domain-containing protein [Vreelandella zhaodongensis]|uniref:DUF6270 domain-containing protein n=1 Tax=Vreelandella zhaodongensis TaxID=1176240 RepID=UPI003EBCAE1F
MSKFLIFGGCVSRDLFNYSDESMLLVDYYARSSFASAFSEPPAFSIDVKKLNSPFQQRCVQRDFDKSFKDKIARGSFDYLLVDFLSNRFNLAVNGSSLLTISNELLKSGFDPKANGYQVIVRNSDKYFVYWKSGFEKFASHCRQAGVVGKVVFNKIYLTDHLQDGGALPGGFTTEVVNKYNEFLDRCYEFSSGKMPEAKWLTYSDANVVGAVEHRWGPGPFHYIDDFYKEGIKQLVALA